MEHFHQHHLEELWNWDDTEARLSHQEEITTLEGPGGFRDRMFFGRAREEITDLKKVAHTWGEVENVVRQKIEEIGDKIVHNELSMHANLKQQEQFWIRFYQQLFQGDYRPRT